MEYDVVGLMISFTLCTIEVSYSLLWGWDSGQMDDSVNTLEERVLLGELRYYLSVIGQVGSHELGSDVGL